MEGFTAAWAHFRTNDDMRFADGLGELLFRPTACRDSRRNRKAFGVHTGSTDGYP